MGFYNASKWKTTWDLEKSLSMGDYVHFTSSLKRKCKVCRKLGYLQESLHSSAKIVLQTPQSRDAPIITNIMSHLVLSQVLSFICQILLPNPNLTPERNLDLPLTLYMLILPFPEIILENSRNIFILKH